MSNFSKKFTLATLSLCLFATANVDTASAQTTLQGAQSGLQQQTGQTQQSVNTQNQTGTLQNTDQSSLLDKKIGVDLGVVSTPTQSTPEVTVSPSNNLTADISQEERSNKKYLIVIVGSLAIATIGLILLRNTRNTPQTLPESNAPVIKPEPMRASKKHKKGTRKQRRKTNQQH